MSSQLKKAKADFYNEIQNSPSHRRSESDQQMMSPTFLKTKESQFSNNKNENTQYTQQCVLTETSKFNNNHKTMMRKKSVRQASTSMVTKRTVLPQQSSGFSWGFLQNKLQLIRKFVKRLKYYSAMNLVSSMQQCHVEYINDIAHFPDDGSNKGLNSCLQTLTHMFNTAYYEEGEMVKDRKKIVLRYLNSDFVLDLITSFVLLLHGIIIREVQLVFLGRLHQLGTIIEEIDQRFQIQQRFPTISTLIKMFIQIFLNAHVSACVFHFIAWSDIKSGDQNTWLHAQDIVDETWKIKYITALYFTVINMSTVGFGDISPQTVNERIYIIIITLLSCGQCAYVVNKIGQIFLDMANKEASFKTKIYEIQKYMGNRQIDITLQRKVIKYLDFIRMMEDEAPQKGHDILNELSSSLKQQVFGNFYIPILQNSKFFKTNFSTEFLEELSTHMNEIVYGPKEIIFNINDMDYNVYFLVKGNLEKGEYFGMRSLMGLHESNVQIKSLNVSHIAYFNYKDFIACIKKHKHDYEKYCMLKDQYNILSVSMFQKCICCKSTSHTIKNCSKMHYAKSKEVIMAKYFYTQDQKREPKNREKKKYNQSLKQHQKIRKDLRKYRLDKMNKAYQYAFQREQLIEEKKMAMYQRGEIQYEDLERINVSLSNFSSESSENESMASDLSLPDEQFFLENDMITYKNKHFEIVEQEDQDESQQEEDDFDEDQDEDESEQSQAHNTQNKSNRSNSNQSQKDECDRSTIAKNKKVKGQCKDNSDSNHEKDDEDNNNQSDNSNKQIRNSKKLPTIAQFHKVMKITQNQKGKGENEQGGKKSNKISFKNKMSGRKTSFKNFLLKKGSNNPMTNNYINKLTLGEDLVEHHQPRKSKASNISKQNSNYSNKTPNEQNFILNPKQSQKISFLNKKLMNKEEKTDKVDNDLSFLSFSREIDPRTNTASSNQRLIQTMVPIVVNNQKIKFIKAMMTMQEIEQMNQLIQEQQNSQMPNPSDKTQINSQQAQLALQALKPSKFSQNTPNTIVRNFLSFKTQNNPKVSSIQKISMLTGLNESEQNQKQNAENLKKIHEIGQINQQINENNKPSEYPIVIPNLANEDHLTQNLEIMILDFDIIMEYKRYFPKNNLTEVLKYHDDKKKKQQKQKQVNRRKSMAVKPIMNL